MRGRAWHVSAALLAVCMIAALAIGWAAWQVLAGAAVLLDIIERAING